jgi:hypothetical protein
VTFRGQSTFILPVAGKPDAFILLADRWNARDLPQSRYLWLPIVWTDAGFEVPWREAWGLDVLDR